MNQELESKLVAAMDLVLSGAKDAAHWTMEQAPEVAREMILLGRIRGAFAVFAAAGFALLFSWITRWAVTKGMKEDPTGVNGPEDGTGYVMCGVVAAMVALVLWGSAIVGVNEHLPAWVAPRVYLLQEAARFVGR